MDTDLQNTINETVDEEDENLEESKMKNKIKIMGESTANLKSVQFVD